jgi:hypothetical protein
LCPTSGHAGRRDAVVAARRAISVGAAGGPADG